MQAYIIQRLLLVPVTLLGVTIVVFGLVRLIPGDTVDQVAGEFAAFDPELGERLREEYGLSSSIPQQYGEWLGDVFRGDLGKSLLSRRSVLGELRNRLPVTFELGAIGLIISLLIALPVGIISAVRQDTVLDYVFRGGAIAMLAIPGFWIAIIIITLGSRWFSWAPPLEYTSFLTDPMANLRILWLPGLLLGLGLSGGVMRLTRTQMLEVLRQDYIRTAWAKGLTERTVIARHALKNALIPIVTVIGLQIPVLVGGTVILEQVFSLPGVGRYLVSSTAARDYPVIQGVNLLIASIVIISNLAVDVTYAYLDPRVRYGAAG
jgi:peptide/nickel transport system permease protein